MRYMRTHSTLTWLGHSTEHQLHSSSAVTEPCRSPPRASSRSTMPDTKFTLQLGVVFTVLCWSTFSTSSSVTFLHRKGCTAECPSPDARELQPSSHAHHGLCLALLMAESSQVHRALSKHESSSLQSTRGEEHPPSRSCAEPLQHTG